MNQQKTIAIIGGGISGLAAAYRAQSVLPEAKITLFESSDRIGGVLKTEHVDGYNIECSADMFVSDPPFAMKLVKSLGKTDQLLQTKPLAKGDKAFVATNDPSAPFHPVPRGLALMMPNDLDTIQQSPLLSEKAKQRFLKEREVPPREVEDDESLKSFAIRRFGKDVFDQLIQPLVSGIYTADPQQLSMRATMAKFIESEKTHGSLIAAAESKTAKPGDHKASGARYGLFRAPERGMGQLIEWIVAATDHVDIRTGCSVVGLEKSNPRWSIKLKNNSLESKEESTLADAVVIATSAAIAGGIVNAVDPLLTEQLTRITAASSAIVIQAIDCSQIERQFDGYGIIVPSALDRKVIATSFSSNKFSQRAPDGKLLIRTFIGGALQSDLVDLNDDELIEIAKNELVKTVGFTGDAELTQVHRWRNCMPQYHVGHLEIMNQIDELMAKHPGIELAGNSYRGVGVPACIQSGYEAVDRLVLSFADR